jgi:hypothetical protein
MQFDCGMRIARISWAGHPAPLSYLHQYQLVSKGRSNSAGLFVEDPVS